MLIFDTKWYQSTLILYVHSVLSFPHGKKILCSLNFNHRVRLEQPYSICFSHSSSSSLQLQPAEQYFSLTALQLQPAEHGERRQRLRQQFESS